MKGFLLRDKSFASFFIAQFSGAFNDNLFRRAIELLIAYQGLSGKIPAQIAVPLLLAVFMSPFFICSSFAGFLADRYYKPRLITYIKGAEVLIVILASWGLIQSNLVLCVLAVLALGVHSAFFGPIKYGIPTELVDEEHLVAANGLIEAGTNIAILSGTVIGGALLMLQAGVWWVSALGLFAASIGLLASFSIRPTRDTQTSNAVRIGVVQLILRVWRDRDLWNICLGIAWFFTLGATLISLLSLVVSDIFKAPEICVSLLFSLFSVGIALGSLLYNRLSRGQIVATWIPISALGLAVSLLGLYFSLPSVQSVSLSTIELFTSLHGIMTSISLLSIAFFGGLFIVPLYALLQIKTVNQERSQIIAASNIISAALMVCASLFISSYFTLGFSVPSAIVVLSIATLGAALYTCLLLPEALLKTLLQVVLRIVFRAKVQGLHYFDSVGPRALIVANHLSFLDAVMLSAFLPGRAAFAINTEISKAWWMSPAMKFFDTIPLDPTSPLAVRVLIDKLKEDKHVVIFPEGRITVTGAMMKIYEGPAMIADKGKAPLVPVRLDGMQYTWFSRIKSLVRPKLFPRLSMTVTEPKKLSVQDELKGRNRREALSRGLHDLMVELMYQTNQRGDTILESIFVDGERTNFKKIAVRDIQGAKLSVTALLKRSFVLSKLLGEKIERSSRIGVLLPNSAAAIVTFFSLLWRGKVPAMLNFSHSPDQLEATQKASLYRTVLTARKFIELAKLQNHIDKLSSLGVEILYLEDLASRTTIAQKMFYAAILTFMGKRLIPSVNRDDEAVVLFTSGSEGVPKGVVLSHSNLLHNIDQVTASVPLMPSDKVFNALPMFHSFGLTGGTLMPLVKGVQVFLYPSPLHYRIIPEVVYNEGSTILFGTPTFLAGYAKKAHPYDFYSLRYVFAGAERLGDSVRALYQERFGLRVFEGYGATETSPIIAVNSPFYMKPGTVGRLVPGIEYKCEPIPGLDEGARLFVKGANIMKGYLKVDKPGVLQPPHDGWYDTGDIVAVDSQGFISIKGRVKRFAKIAGEMVSLSAVEQILERAFSSSLHCVVSVPDERKGERLILFTSLKEATRDLIATTLRKGGLPELAVPRDIRIQKTLPMLGSGKIDFRALTEMVLAEGNLQPEETTVIN